MPTKDYQTDLLQRLANREYAAQYLKAAFDETSIDGNKSVFLLALKNVVDASEAQISRQHLYRILSE
jgi:DNA-binding phage protein